MLDKYTLFDSARLELAKGINLVEASAGTGKTYAIGMLVLRAVVELQVPMKNILVVTFTKAATEELKSRIRARLVEARDLFVDDSQAQLNGNDPVDETLLTWAKSVRDPQAAHASLQLALYDIDQAGIFTIHGFCQRMLVEQALESGQLFDVELLADIAEIRLEVARDFWRQAVYPLDPLSCSVITSHFPGPDLLLESVTAVFRGDGPIEPLVTTIELVLEQLSGAMDGLVLWWGANSEELYQQLFKANEEGKFKKKFSDTFDSWYVALHSFFQKENHVLPENLQLLSRSQLFDEINGNKLRGNEKKEAFLDSLSLPTAEMDSFLEAMDQLLLTVRVNLGLLLRKEVSRRLERRGQMGFNDLITRLSVALRGEDGERLRHLLGERFRVALIDEFQDTDSCQYHIFSTLFGNPDHYLYLIGDPKQAIYKFRGADIHSYFLAQNDAGQLLTLEKNYRSHPYLVEEVNRLFGCRKNPFVFEEDVLGYRPVTAAKTVEDADLVHRDKSLAGMVYCTLDENPDDKEGRWSSGKAATQLRQFVVNELGLLLDEDGPYLVVGEDTRSLAPHDIAILVRSNRQAEEYRAALAEVQIPAVVGSRLSVFATEQCRELLLLLTAIAAPGDVGLLKTAMTLPWFGMTGQELHALWQDDQQLNNYHSRFVGYNQLWQERGLLTMMSKFLVVEDVLPTLAAGKLAERIIANILHLLQLFQEKESSENLGMGQLLQWLRKTMHGGQGVEESELLLESDEEAVRIVTMHSAKGLEYPVVFCPYLWYSSNRLQTEKHQLNCYNEQQKSLVDLGSDQFEIRRERAIKEEMAEELRLLYVALTRAKVRCYTAWVDVKKSGSVGESFGSSLGYLLFNATAESYQQQQERFQLLANEVSVFHQTVSLDAPSTNYKAVNEDLELKPVIVDEGAWRSLHTDWQMSSFSGLAGLSEYEHEATGRTAKKEAGDQGLIPVTGLPAGPDFGNLIHDLLEEFSFTAIAQATEQEKLEQVINQKCSHLGIESSASNIENLLKLLVKTKLLPEFHNRADIQQSFSLSMLLDDYCLKEMGFYFHLGQLQTGRINTILQDEPTVTKLSHKEMRGYLTGFVDLICENQGKFYIIDYKTNFLGDRLSDYGPDNLVAAMQSHNYGLQYWIYTLVLHRHLKNILPNYDYQHHFGGVMYLFVRGMVPEIPGSGVFYSLPSYHKILELDQTLGGTAGD